MKLYKKKFSKFSRKKSFSRKNRFSRKKGGRLPTKPNPDQPKTTQTK